MLYLNSHVRFDDITDGPAQTILLGEFRQSDPRLLGWASGTRSTLRNTGHPLNDPVIARLRSSRTRRNSPTARRFAAMTQMAEDGVLPVEFVGGFSSLHPIGSNFLFCDGSVRFLKTSIDRARLSASGPSCRWRADQRRCVLSRDPTSWMWIAGRWSSLSPRIGRSGRLRWCDARRASARRVRITPMSAATQPPPRMIMPTWMRMCIDRFAGVRRGIGRGPAVPTRVPARSRFGPTRPPCSGLERAIATRRPAGSSCTSRASLTSGVTSTAG